jgi:hypothetical protein
MTLQEGTYKARAIPESMKFGYAGSGTEQVGMNFEITEEGFAGARVGWYGSFAGEAEEITLRQLRDAGWQGRSLTDTTGLGAVECEVRVYYEEWQGKTRMKVSVQPMGGLGVRMDKPLDDKALRMLDARLKAKIAASARAAPGGAAPAPFTPPPAKPAPVTRPAAPAQEWDGTGPDPNAGDDDLPY